MKLNLKRFLAYLLTALMLVSVVPASAIAEITAASNTSASIRSIMPDQGVYVTFEFYAGEKLVDTQIVKNDAGSVTEPETPITEPGQKFLGWYVEDVPFNFGPVTGYSSTQTVRVEARYSDVYYVFFKDNNGRIVETKEGKTNDSIQTGGVSFPVDVDQSITGWYTDEAFTNKVDSVTLEDKNVTLYAKVEKGYWITYDSKGGSYIQPTFYAKGTTAKAPADPTRPGYNFGGWYTDDALTVSANFGSITENTTVHAKWTAASTTYTVIHFWENADDDKYSYHESETKTGTTGAQTAAVAKSYPGFTAQTITQKTIAADGSTIVSVYYKRNVYTVTFWSVKWKGIGLLGSYVKDKEYTDKRITAKYGQNISDNWPGGIWSISAGGSTFQANIDVMPLGGDEFFETEQGNAKAYYYLQDLNGKYVLHHTDTGAGGGATVTNEDRYPITGFTCNTKLSAKNDDWYNGAKFYYDRNSYAIKFISGGKTVNSQSVKYQASIAGYAGYEPDTAPTGKEGYIFDGWYDNELCEGDPYAFAGKTMPAQPITVYAKWVAPVHTVTVYAADRTTVLKTIPEIPHGSKIDEEAMPEVTLGEGEVFLGWVLADGTPFNFNTEIKKDYDIYAKVGNTSKFKVIYNANAEDAAGEVKDDNTYARGAFADVKPNGFTNGDKMFLYWSLNEDGTGKRYYPNDKIEITGNVTLYAIWATPGTKVTLTYHSNFGEQETTKTFENLPNNTGVEIRDYTDSDLEMPTREGYTFTVWNTQADGKGTDYKPNDSVRLEGDGNDLYAQWTADNHEYTVEFYYETTDGEYELKKTDLRTAKTDALVAVTEDDKAETYDGKYVFDAANELNELNGVIPATGSLVLKLYFKLNTANYTIHHYLKGTTVQVADDETGTMTIGHTLTAGRSDALYADYKEATVASYDPSQSITIAATGNVITVYYTVPLTIKAEDATKVYDGKALTQPDFTVTGLVNGDTKAKFTLSMTAGSTITDVGSQQNVIDESTAKYNGKAISSSYYTVTYEDGTLTINPRSVTLTSGSGEKVYDGTALTNDTVTVSGDGFVNGEGATYTVTGSQVNEGESENTFTYTLKDNTKAKNYTIETVFGKLKVTPVTDEIVVTIVGNTKTETYNGKEQRVTGYTVTSISNKLYKSEYIGFTGEAIAKGTDADTYQMGLSEKQFKNISKNFTNVKFEVTDGSLTINPIAIELTAKSAEKEYDGTPLTDDGYEITSGKFVEGEGLESVTVEGSQTLVGSSANTITGYALKTGTKAQNYAITCKPGTLTVKDRTTQYEITVKANSGEKVYDGTPLTVEDFETLTFTVNGLQYTVEGLTASKTGTNVSDSGAVEVKGTAVVKDADGNDVTAQFKVVTVNGMLAINPKPVTITAEDASKEYDGDALTQPEFTTTALEGGDTHEFAVAMTEDSTITNVGTKANVIATVDGEAVTTGEAKQIGNYLVTTVNGTLTITASQTELKVTANSNSWTYDGKEHSNGGYTVEFGTEKYTVKAGESATLSTGDKVTATITKTVKNVSDTEEGNNAIVTLVVENENQYGKITKLSGTLAITPVTTEVVVTIVGKTKTETYDGTEKGVTGYTVESISNPLYTEGDFTFTGEAAAKGTDADTYPMGLKAEQFKNTSANFTNVKFDVTDGWLKIDPRKVTLTSGDGEKVYDGNPLTNSEVTVSGDGFADGEGADYTVTGSQLNAGESENEFTYALKANTKAQNYTIETVFGTLKVTPVTDEVVVTITGREDSAQYDGAKHSVSGYDVAISNALYTEDCFEFGGKAVAEGVHAGEYAMGLNEKQFKNVSANFTNVKFVIERDGRLTIEQRALIITAGSYEGDYDGEWHGVGYTAEGLAETDKITALTMKDDAILYPGELTASFLPETLKITHADGTDSTGDYRVEYMPGKLVVNTVIVKYRVQYYYDGVLYGGATEEGTGEVLTKITEYRDKPRDMMFDHVDNFPLTLGLNEEENVIRVYYVHIPLTGYLGAHNVGDCIE